MNTIPAIRTEGHRLTGPAPASAAELVAWMGAVQAQSYDMAKWAVGIRLASAGRSAVEQALGRGDILRTHILRPTWHFVACGDIRWMLRLSARRIRAAHDSWARSRKLEISERLYAKATEAIGRMLEGGRSLTGTEIAAELERTGTASGKSFAHHFLLRAETEGIVCSGPDKGKSPTYALFDERVPPSAELCRDEALARLARRYFRSHAPASANDFAWWSGLPLGEAREAIGSIAPELVRERSASETHYIHESCSRTPHLPETVHLLPAYDEYLIGYKDRSAVLADEHRPRAFNDWGIFHPVLLYRGIVAGNWKKAPGKRKNGETGVTIDLFPSAPRIPEEKIRQAIRRYTDFLSK